MTLSEGDFLIQVKRFSVNVWHAQIYLVRRLEKLNFLNLLHKRIILCLLLIVAGSDSATRLAVLTIAKALGRKIGIAVAPLTSRKLLAEDSKF